MARPRAFDEGKVLDRATEVFWRNGYDGASMTDLTGAMGINSPSVYKAFGSKRGLFDAVLARYDERRAAFAEWMLAGGTAREVAERVLVGSVDWLTDPGEPLGCLLVQAAAGSASPDLPRELAGRRGRLERVLTQRFERAKTEGDLAGDCSAEGLARYVGTIFSGLAVQAAAGVDPEDLRRVAVQALQGWPASQRCATP